MANIQIITDSTAYLDRNFVQKYEIEVVPLSVSFEGEILQEGFPGEFDAFFNRLSRSNSFPTTSQPSVGAFKAVYEKALKNKKEIIVLTISSKLSGTYSSAVTAATLVDQSKISVIDSLTAAANLKALIESALGMMAQGKSRLEIAAALEVEKNHTGIRLTVGTLDYLKKGGRLTNTEALIGSLLNIKPIIALVEGKLEAAGKVRGRKKAIEKLIEGIPPQAKVIHIAQIDAMDEALALKETLQGMFSGATVEICELGPVVGAHLGPKALGVLFKC